ncbi:uncharacterized protein THITE_2141895 [Thermothielavioides terrestris NRRL 8126]|uniref:Serine aminopeptidase S33 domain-containing protein n=1 Tax=Thermothielavioides terrestris (strain ATCC 38088 / NRRL 8126) TaxID=578455 RepID=G2QWC5_THETT|nr:uncharacterized protein THITE_2141895 [Thermothielavioides terrestris NRRL 8126]AEO63900.1 hypothetical protein THITE_2141895 [Thermothielavioides terrestris NRRL 8126]
MKWHRHLLDLGISGVAARRCQNVSVSLDLSFRNAVFDLDPPASTVEMTNFFLNLARQGHNYSSEVLTGYATISGTSQIAATFCTPGQGPGKTLQLLTHGLTLDKSYWDIPFHSPNYSYVAAAVDQYGYSTFAWDLLGAGGSQRGDPVDELQYNLQSAALAKLTAQLRAGAVRGVPRFARVAHVGHSYGAIQTYTLGVRRPAASDALVLTGFSHSPVGFAPFLLGGNFGAADALPQLADYRAGYFANSGEAGVQTGFFAPGNFDTAMLRYIFETMSAAAVGEMLTLGPDLAVISPFDGPVLVITGQRDVGFCGGDCSITGDPSLSSLLDITKSMIPNANPFQSFVVPNAGHLLTAEFTHPLAFKAILDFLVPERRRSE